MKDTRFAKLVLFVNSLVPLVLLLWDLWRKNVGANPLEFVTRTTGMLTLVFLLLTLAVSPLRRVLGLNWLIKFRRMLGLFAFFYGCLHLLTYIAFDRSEEHTSELQSPYVISYAVFCLKKNKGTDPSICDRTAVSSAARTQNYQPLCQTGVMARIVGFLLRMSCPSPLDIFFF